MLVFCSPALIAILKHSTTPIHSMFVEPPVDTSALAAGSIYVPVVGLHRTPSLRMHCRYYTNVYLTCNWQQTDSQHGMVGSSAVSIPGLSPGKFPPLHLVKEYSCCFVIFLHQRGSQDNTFPPQKNPTVKRRKACSGGHASR